MTGSKAAASPLRIAATIFAAAERARDSGSVVCLCNRSLDALVELHGLDPQHVATALPLFLRDKDYHAQAKFLGWERADGSELP